MNKILDREEKVKETIFWKNSWFVVLAANGILVLMSIYQTYSFFSSPFVSDKLPLLMILDSILSSISSLMFVCNFVLLFVSLFFSKTYWKKWLLMVVIGLILYGINKIIYPHPF